MNGMADAAWSFMQPWCEPLRGLLSIQIEQGHLTMKFAGIGVHLPTLETEDTMSKLRAIRKALVLMTLLAHVDDAAWKNALVEYCDLSITDKVEVFESEEFEPRFVFTLNDQFASAHLDNSEDSDEDMWVSSVLPAFLVTAAHEDAAFAAAAARIASVGANVALSDVGIPIVVCISLEFFEDDVVLDHFRGVWNSIKELKARVGGYRFPVGSTNDAADDGILRQCSFVLSLIDADSSLCALTPGLAAVVEEMATAGDGLVFRHLAFNVTPPDYFVGNDNFNAAKITGKSLEQVLCANQPSDRSVLKAVTLQCENTDPPEIARVCSAIAQASTTKDLTVMLETEEEVPEMWMWIWERLAYALFSKHSQSSITKFTLFGAYVTTEAVDAIAAVLRADNPAHFLFGQPFFGGEPGRPLPPSGDDFGLMMLKRGAHVTLQQLHPHEPVFTVPSWSLPTDIRGIKVLNDERNQESVLALLPGYGVCKVQREQLVPAGDAKGRSGVTTLNLMVENEPEAWEGLPGLLELVGKSLTRLWIQILSADDLLRVDGILKWCPNLQALAIRGIKVDTQSFLDVYRENHLKISELDCDFDDVAILAKELARPSSLVAQNVLCWSYSFRSEADTSESGRVEGILQMLRSNCSLQYLSLVMPREQHDASLERFERHRNEPLPVLGDRFPLINCTAFLSIFGSSSRRRGPKRAKADSTPTVEIELLGHRHVVSIIFDFAAQCLRRKVHLRHYDPPRGLMEWQ